MIKNKKKLNSIGIDITSIGVVYSKIVKTENLIILLDAGFIPFKNNEKTDESIKDALKIVAEKIKKKFSIRQIIVSGLVGKSVSLKQITSPKMNNTDRTTALKFELRKSLPFDVSTAVVDFEVLKELPDTNEEELLVIAASGEYLNTQMGMFKKSGIDLDIMDIKYLAMINCLLFNYPKIDASQTSVIINITTELTQLIIYNKDKPLFTREIDFSGYNLIKKIQVDKRIDFAEAQDFCKSNDIAVYFQEVASNTATYLRSFSGEIIRSLSYYDKQYKNANYSNIYLTGEFSRLLGLRNLLFQELELGIVDLQPYWGITLNPEKKDDFYNLVPMLSASIGYAIRPFFSDI